MKKILETPRLFLRELTQEDASFVIELVNSEGWLRFIGDRNIRTAEQATQYIANLQKGYETNGFGLWLAVLRETGKAVGMCGLIKRDTLPHIDLGFAFLPTETGKGYAFEASQATLQYAQQTLHAPKVLAIVLPANERSCLLLAKLGFQQTDTVQIGEENLALWEIAWH